MTVKLSVNTVEKVGLKEKRTTQYAKGMRSGMIKGTIDKIVNQISDPLADRIQPMLNNLHPGMQMADPAVKVILRFSLITALAEILDHAGPALAKVPGIGMTKTDASDKTRALAQFMRNYAGETLGSELTEAAAALIPTFIDLFQSMDLKELMGAVADQEVGVEQAQEA